MWHASAGFSDVIRQADEAAYLAAVREQHLQQLGVEGQLFTDLRTEYDSYVDALRTEVSPYISGETQGGRPYHDGWRVGIGALEGTVQDGPIATHLRYVDDVREFRNGYEEDDFDEEDYGTACGPGMHEIIRSDFPLFRSDAPIEDALHFSVTFGGEQTNFYAHPDPIRTVTLQHDFPTDFSVIENEAIDRVHTAAVNDAWNEHCAPGFAALRSALARFRTSNWLKLDPTTPEEVLLRTVAGIHKGVAGANDALRAILLQPRVGEVIARARDYTPPFRVPLHILGTKHVRLFGLVRASVSGFSDCSGPERAHVRHSATGDRRG